MKHQLGLLLIALFRKNTDDLIAVANDSTLVFAFKKQNIKLFDFIEYVKSVRYSGKETGNKKLFRIVRYV